MSDQCLGKALVDTPRLVSWAVGRLEWTVTWQRLLSKSVTFRCHSAMCWQRRKGAKSRLSSAVLIPNCAPAITRFPLCENLCPLAFMAVI